MSKDKLPSQPTPFIGREDELAEIAKLLGKPDCRLLTLVGPGGIGKTRLALEAARLQQSNFTDGVYFVPFQPLTSPEFIVSSIADALHFQFYPGDEPMQQLLDYLREKTLLLVLDNLEHLIEAVELLSDMLKAAPETCILATSRERLNVLEEWVFNVREMRYPTNEAETDIEAYEAVQLFVQQARRVRADFRLTSVQKPSVIRICRLVGGMPLGIELAATWVRALSLEEIAHQISGSLDILETSSRNIQPRHRTLRAALEPTWKRLSDEQQTVFKRLSVFRGSFSHSAAEAVAGASLNALAALIDKSLLRHDPASGRYDLHELLRQYAAEQLSLSNENEAARDAHSAYYAAFLQAEWKPLRNEQQVTALKEIELEYDNIRSAWRNMSEKCKVAELSQSIYTLWYYAGMVGREYDALLLCQEAGDALRHAPDGDDVDRALGQVLTAQGYCCVALGRPREGQSLIEEGLAKLWPIGTPENLVLAFRCLTFANTYNDETEAMNRNAEQSAAIARRSGDHWLIAWSLYELGFARIRLAKLEEARQIAQECLEHVQVCGDIWLRGGCLAFLQAHISTELGEYATAERQLDESYPLLLQFMGQHGIHATHILMGYTAFCLNNYHRAGYHYRQSLLLASQIGGSRTHDRYTIIKIADLWAAHFRYEAAVELLTVVGRNPQGLPWAQIDVSGKLRALEAKLSAQAFAAAQERGMRLDLKQVISQLVNTLPATLLDTPMETNETLPNPLTTREVEILQHLMQGLTNREIAEALVITSGTVRWYLNQIYSKLQVKSRTQAMIRARELNLSP